MKSMKKERKKERKREKEREKERERERLPARQQLSFACMAEVMSKKS